MRRKQASSIGSNYRLGPGLETIAGLDGPFDFVFIDADKESYVDYYEAVLPKLADDGLIVADNVLLVGPSRRARAGGRRRARSWSSTSTFAATSGLSRSC